MESLNDREGAEPEVQAAMVILGDEKLATRRNIRFDGNACISKNDNKSSLATINLSHLALNNLDLNGADFSCLDMTQSHFHRTNFRDASLQATNFSGATFDDWQTWGFNETIDNGQPDRAGTKRAEWLYDKKNEWKRSRCWVADFRGANLKNALFYGAGLAGVDFRGSDLTDVRFDGANISRANFKGATVRREQLNAACADEQPLHDFSLIIGKC